MSDNGNGNPAPPPTKQEIVAAVALLWRVTPPGATIRFALPIQPAILAPGESAPVLILDVHAPTQVVTFQAGMPRRLAYPEASEQERCDHIVRVVTDANRVGKVAP